MPLEIERKYLVDPTRIPCLGDGRKIVQGYLSRDPQVRVRITEAQSTIAVKKGEGVVRLEFEFEIPLGDAQAMLSLAIMPPIEKMRYTITNGNTIWKIDEFTAMNAGLWIAEIDLLDPCEVVNKPEWVTAEVTDDVNFTNLALSANPYTGWTK